VALLGIPEAAAIWEGLELEHSAALASEKVALPAGTPDDPFVSHLTVGRDWLQPAAGPDRVDRLARIVDRLRRSHHRTVLTVRQDSRTRMAAPSPVEVEEWTGLLRRLTEVAGEALVAIEPLSGQGAARDAVADAFLLKQSAVAIRSSRPEVRVILGLGPGSGMESWLRQLYDNDVEPYVDAWVWQVAEGGPVPDPGQIASLSILRRELDPAAGLWVFGLPAGLGGPDSEAALFGRLSGAGVGLMTFRVRDDRTALLEALHRYVPSQASPMPAGGVAFQDAAGAELEGIAAWRFFDAEDSAVQILIVPAARAPDRFRVVVDTFDLSSPVLFELGSGAERYLAGTVPDQRANRTTLDLDRVQGPVILEYRRFTRTTLEREEMAVAAQREPPVEEILARHQEVQVAAESGVETVVADALVEFHYTVAGSGATIDVAYRSRYFWDRSLGAEYQHREFFVNGARWTRKKIPDLPLIQPEKVVTPPLLINMGRQYGYRLKGRARIEGRPAWRIDFEPVDPEAARFAGTAWIDRESFRLLKLTVRQTGLEPPVLSSEETHRFTELTLPDGAIFRHVDRIDGQQIWNTAGANFVVNREVRLENFRVNSPQFWDERRAAWASDDQILRDTDQGLRYLVKNREGEREVQEEPESRSLFLLGGLFYNEAVDYPVPFAGINYFDFDFRRRDQQINLFLAGAANFITWADPTVFGTRADAAVNLGLIAFASSDRYYVDGEELESVEVDNRPQRFSASLGVPFGDFVKLRGRYSLAFDNYQRGEDMAPSFIVPVDTLTHSVGAQLQFNRSGFNLTADGQASRRNNWEPWGDPDPGSGAVGSRLVDFDERFEDYWSWSVSMSQDVFLKAFQKLRFSAAWLDGSDLDRFSQYQFSFFGGETRVRGFSGSGIRFDQGGMVQTRYTFNLADLVTFDAGVDFARVENSLTDDGFQSHAGVGFAGKFLGPWGLILQVEYGLAAYSDVAAVEREQEIQLLLLKIF
jgi:hypothetical protein